MAQLYAPVPTADVVDDEKQSLLRANTPPRQTSSRLDRAFLATYGIYMGTWIIAACVTVAIRCAIFSWMCLPITGSRSSPVDTSTLDPTTCALPRRGLMDAPPHPSALALTLTWCAILVLPLVAAKLLLVACHRAPRALVYGSMYANLGLFSLLAMAGTVSFAVGSHKDDQKVIGTGIVLTVVGGVFLLTYGLVYWSLRKRLDFVSSMLGTASACIAQNKGILYVSLATMGTALLVQAPLLGLIGAAAMRQDVYRPNPSALHIDGHTCTNALHNAVPCCVPEPTGLPMVIVLTGIPLVSWTSFIVWGVRIFCIGGLVHAWYYAPTGSTARVGVAYHLKTALTDGLPCIAVGGLVNALVAMLRSLCENRALRFVMRLIEKYVNWVSTYALLYAGMTGMPFFPAAHKSHELLTSNLLESISVGALPAMALGLIASTFSLAVGAVVGTSAAVLMGLPPAPQGDYFLCTGMMLGFVAFGVSLVALSFVAGMVADATNAVYLCYALDRSQQMVTKPQVHQDFAKLVAPAGLVVEQPGGGVAYAPVSPVGSTDVELQGPRV